MAARSIGSVTLVIGLVAIPAKLYTATSQRELAFNRLDRATGSRVKQQLVSAADGRLLEHADLISGFEYTPDKFVTFTAEELQALAAEADPDVVRIKRIVPAATVDPTHIVKSIFLGPNKGANRSYHLLASLLAHRGQVAIAQRGTRTRDDIFIVAPHRSGEGLVMHECLYEDEVRLATIVDPQVVPPGVVLAPEELELGNRLLDSFERSDFRNALADLVDTGDTRVKAAVDRKVAGHEIVVPPPRKDAGLPIDLLEQLRASVPVRGPKKTRAPAAPASQAQSRRRARAS